MTVSIPSGLLNGIPTLAASWPVIVGGEGEGRLTLRDVLDAGGTIGYLIIVLSVLMVALIVQLVLLLRRNAMMPYGLADEVHQCLAEGRAGDADEACRRHPSVLARMLSAGIAEVRLGYAAVEKAMEDAAVEQSARLLRRVEYLTTIGTVAPMLGLLGTVWGMILAFLEFEQQANPQVSQLAPGIYRALVTTLFGLMVAVPAVSAYAIFRNRVDERIAESALLAEYVFSDYKRRKREPGEKEKREKPRTVTRSAASLDSPPPIPPVAIQRERRP